ncbi:MAG TPA: hypothetical protein VEA69_14345 [Tepidisphaeraceae bacterium]|nr:hypothetical protein [Tepidisphaeraceae bacterium]
MSILPYADESTPKPPARIDLAVLVLAGIQIVFALLVFVPSVNEVLTRRYEFDPRPAAHVQFAAHAVRAPAVLVGYLTVSGLLAYAATRRPERRRRAYRFAMLVMAAHFAMIWLAVVALASAPHFRTCWVVVGRTPDLVDWFIFNPDLWWELHAGLLTTNFAFWVALVRPFRPLPAQSAASPNDN